MEIYARNYCLTPYVLFSVTVTMFLDRSKIPTGVLCRIPQETFVTSLVLIDQVVSEEKTFERNNIKNIKKRWKRAIIPTWLNTTNKINFIMLNTFTNAQPNSFGDICKKLLSDPPCSIFSNGGHVFRRIKNLHLRFYAGYP